MMQSSHTIAGRSAVIFFAAAILNLCACTKTTSTGVTISASGSSIGSGTATLTWEPPRRNVDGSALRNLAGYYLYYGTSPTNLNQTIKIPDPYVTMYKVDKLSPGTYYFRIVAFTADGTRSSASEPVSKTIP